MTTCLRDKEKKSIEYSPATAVLSNLESFADSVTGLATYPVPQDQMIANVSALEAVFRSAKTGRAEAVEN